jgi:hypothetical protein
MRVEERERLQDVFGNEVPDVQVGVKIVVSGEGEYAGYRWLSLAT